MWLVTLHYGAHMTVLACAEEVEARRAREQAYVRHVERWDRERADRMKRRDRGEEVDLRMGVRPEVRLWREEVEGE